MARLIALAAAVALPLTGCSSISSGVITEKVHEPETEYWVTQCVVYNSKGMCTSWMPVRHVDTEDWRFILTEPQDGSYRGERKTGWVDVPRETYDAYSVGDYYPGGN